MALKNDEIVPMLELGNNDEKMHRRTSFVRLVETDSRRDNYRSLIHQSARKGDINILREAILANPQDANYSDSDGNTPLHYGARYGHKNVVDFLLTHGGSPEIKNFDGDTPLHVAAKYKYEIWSEISMIVNEAGEKVVDAERDAEKLTRYIINALVSSQATINAGNQYKLTPLHYAAIKSNTSAISILLELGADVNAQDVNEMTPLLLGCVHGTQETISKLLTAGSDISKQDQRQNTVFHIVALRGEPEYLKMMLDIGKGWSMKALSMKNNEGKTPLRLAVEGNHPETLRQILELETKNSKRWMSRESGLIHLAASKGYFEVLEALINAGGNSQERDGHQALPLHLAAKWNQKQIVEYLLEKTEIDAVDDYGMTPLMMAVSHNSIDVVQLLIAKNADINLTDNDERTIVYIGAKYNALESVKYILEYLRDKKSAEASLASRKTLRKKKIDKDNFVNATDRDQNTAMHIIAYNGYIEMMRLLHEFGASITNVNEDEETPLHRAAVSGETLAVRQLIEWDHRLLLQKDEMGNSALHLASKRGNDLTTKVLLEAGADREARNSYQQTPLMVAVEAGFLGTTQQLVDRGADVQNMSDSRTVLHLAAERGHETIARYLISRGAQVDRRDETGRTALDIACEANKKDVAHALLETPQWQSLMIAHDTVPIGNRDKNGEIITTKKRKTPFRGLLSKFPDLASMVMDKCVERNKEDEDETYCVAYNFEYIDDTYMMPSDDQSEFIGSVSPYDDNFKLLKEADEYASNYDDIFKNHPLKLMANAEKLSLLSHPLSLALLKHKWNKLGRWVYYLGLTIYCTFIISLTQYVRHTKAPYNVEKEKGDYYDYKFFDEQETCPAVQLETPNPIWKSIILVFAISQLVKEIFQLYQRKLSYLYNWENWLECFIYSTAILAVIDFSDCSSSSGVRRNWQWLLIGLCIFIGWINLLFMIRKMPRFGIYVVMFVDIVKTFFRFFPIFVLIIIAFSTSFYVILQNRPEFSTIFLSPLKTTVMMIGEFEFTGIFHGDHATHEEKMFGTAHTIVAYSLFFLFCIIMTILLMNLLVGLAVDDIKGVQEKAELRRLAMQVDLVLQIEASAYWIRRRGKYATSRYASYPYGKLNRGSIATCWSHFRKRFGLNALNENDEIAHDNAESEAASELRASMHVQRNALELLQSNVDVMYEKQVRLEAMIKLLAKGLDIKMELEEKD